MKEKQSVLSVPRPHSPLVWMAVFMAATSLLFSSLDLFDAERKIAYVRSSELIYGYIGMKEAEQTMKEKMQLWQANIDTLEGDFNTALNTYNQEYSKYSKEEHSNRRQFLQKQQENLDQYKQALELKAQEEQQQITQGILNQINSFAADYGKKNGYDIILGTTSSGSLLYGADVIDITDELLAELNRNYKREP